MPSTTCRTRRALAFLAAAAVALAACSGHSAHGVGSSSNTTTDSSHGSGPIVDITMRDIAFDADPVIVAAGTAITFHFENIGAAVHDAFIGDAAAQAEHELEMSAEAAGSGSAPATHGHDMTGGHHGDGSALTLDPGGHGMLTHTFDKPGTYEIGCHQPGHYATGMRLEITVT